MKLEHLQNGIFEPLRLLTVSKGYFPDIVDYLDPVDQAGFDAAKQAIITGGKQLIEVFNVGNYDSREQTHTNDIAIDMIAIEASGTGTKSVPVYTENEGNDNFDKVKTPDAKYDVTFQITYIAYSEEYAAIIERILTEAFGIRQYLKPYDNDGNELTEGFRLHRIQSFDTSGDEFIERGYRYQAVNIDLAEDQVQEAVSKLEELQFEMTDEEGNETIMPPEPEEIETPDSFDDGFNESYP
jgi:hypothetical protein